MRATPIRMKPLILTDDKIERLPDGRLTARLASTRLRLICAFNALDQARHTPFIAGNASPQGLLEAPEATAASHVLFGKLFNDYLPFVEAVQANGAKIGVDITDDFAQFQELQPMFPVIERADFLTAASPALAELASDWVKSRIPCRIIDDPFEAEIIPPRTARPYDELLKLLWFGSTSNLPHLLPHLVGLRELAERRPLELTIVTPNIQKLGALIVKAGFPIELVEWSIEAQGSALDHADFVLLPGSLEGDSRLKSANRLITAIAAGKYTIATPLPSYQPFEAFCTLGEDLPKLLDEAVRMPLDTRQTRILAGQEHIRRNFSPGKVGQDWLSLFEELA